MLCVFLLVLCFYGPAADARPPHIVFIVVDDLEKIPKLYAVDQQRKLTGGWNDVGWHNPDILTPNLDKLAREGVILNSSYVQPMCTPSRGAFMTGYYPYHLGLQAGAFQIKRPQHLPLNVTTLPEKLKQLGYSTHIVGNVQMRTRNTFERASGVLNADSFVHINPEAAFKQTLRDHMSLPFQSEF